MSKEIGPREKALREMREANFENAKEVVRKYDASRLREKVAAVPVRKPKAAKKKQGLK